MQTHIYTHMESGLNQSYVQKAGGYSRTVNYKNTFYCSFSATSPTTWIIRIHLRRVNTIYTDLFTSAEPERGHNTLHVHSHSAWQLNNTPFSVHTGVCGWLIKCSRPCTVITSNTRFIRRPEPKNIQTTNKREHNSNWKTFFFIDNRWKRIFSWTSHITIT